MIKLDIISKCNFNCCFCSRPVIENKNGVMWIEDIIKIFNLLDRLKVPYIDMAPVSGEFFLHPQYKEILSEMIRRKNHTFELITNGFLCTRDDLLLLSEAKNIKVGFSIYGKDYDEFKQITGRRDVTEKEYLNSYEKLSEFQNESFYFGLRTLTDVSPLHIHNLNLTKEFYKNDFSIRTGGIIGGHRCSMFAAPITITWDKRIIACPCTRPNFGKGELEIGYLETQENLIQLKRNSNFLTCLCEYIRNGVVNFKWCGGCLNAINEPEKDFNYEGFSIIKNIMK